jgi:hypothetical protein
MVVTGLLFWFHLAAVEKMMPVNFLFSPNQFILLTLKSLLLSEEL